MSMQEEWQRLIAELERRQSVAEAVVWYASEHFGGQAKGHLQRIGAVVVGGEGELLELVEEQLGGGAVGFQAQAAGGQEGAEAADADALVGVVVDQPGVDAQDALAAEAGFEFRGQEFLVLVGFHAENVGPELPIDFDTLGDHLRSGATGQVGLGIQEALAVDGK